MESDEYMVKSKEYILKLLDKWYANRYRKNYTPELEREIIESLEEELKHDFFLNFMVIVTMAKEKLKRESVIEEAGKYFTQAHVTIQYLLANEPKYISKGVRQEYLEPFFKEYEKMQRFVESVRKIGKDKGLDDLTNEDIDKAFIECFVGYQGFNDFTIALTDALPYVLNLSVIKGVFDQVYYDNIIKFIEIAKKKMPYLNEKIFGDLKKE